MNKNLIPFKSTLLKNKLAAVIDALQRARDEEAPQTKEALLREAIKLVSTFYKQLNTAGYNPVRIFPTSYPNASLYNDQLHEILADLEILFAELENIEGVVLEQFNIATTATTKLNGDLKRIASKVADYSLYARLPIKDRIYLTDSFADFSKLDIDSSLINSVQAEINYSEGIVTLPINRATSKTIQVLERPVINSASNGRAGNNEDLLASALNSNLDALLDSNPDTWFEYERVDLVDTLSPLILDMTLNLSTPEIVNYIRINPNNFGTKNHIKIVSIDTSLDGQIFTSIKDDIPISGYLTQDEENVFALAPATAKFAGQGVFTFTPRKVKYVRLVLQQNTPYSIDTLRGPQARYAIGLRDIELQCLAFDSEGEVISKPITLTSEVVKVALDSTQTPVQESELAGIKHQVSFDDGVSWHNLRPRSFQGVLNSTNVDPEILTLNLDTVTGSIKTETPPTTVRYRAILSRDDAGFTSGSASFAESIVDTVELRNAPRAEPWTVSLTHPPLLDSVKLIDPNFGSRGKNTNRYLAGYGRNSQIYLRLPWNFGINDLTKVFEGGVWKEVESQPFEVYVAGKQWTLTNTLSEHDEDDQVYAIGADVEFQMGEAVTSGDGFTSWSGHSVAYARVDFGDNVTGEAPGEGAEIEVVLTPERLYLTSADTRQTQLAMPSTRDKSQVRVVRRGEIIRTTHNLERSSTIHRLPVGNIVIDDDHTIGITDGTVFNPSKKRDFINGKVSPAGELDEAGAWSIDTTRGIIYSFSESNASLATTVSFFYRDDIELTTAQWDWADVDPLADHVKVSPDAWVTKTRTYTIPTGTTRISLPDLSVVKGSVRFTVPSLDLGTATDPFIQEVEFTGDPTTPELTSVIKTEETIPTLVPSSNKAVFVLKAPIVNNSLLAVAFSNIDVFVTQVASVGLVDTLGEWHVELNPLSVDYGKVTVYIGASTITDTGKVNYYIQDGAQNKGGAYCIDYSRGVVHVQTDRATPAGCTVSYEYSDYFIHYNIARVVDKADWYIDPVAKKITLKPAEITRKASLSQAISNSSVVNSSYQVSYKYIARVRQDIAELAPYFSPVLKDYALEIITRENL